MIPFILRCRAPCSQVLERQAQMIAEARAFKQLMLDTPVDWISNLIYLRSMILALSPAQKIAAHNMLEMIRLNVPRDWSVEALHSFSMWMPMELQHVIDGVNSMEIENQSQEAVEAEADALLRGQPIEVTN